MTEQQKKSSPSSLPAVHQELPRSYKERIELFTKVIQEPHLDFKKIRDLSFGGIPDELRSIYWKSLLSYLPDDRTSWPKVLGDKRRTYQEFLEVLVIDPRKNEAAHDHPLSTSTDSQWRAFFKDKELIEEVDKDVKRTLPHLHFFNHDKKSGDTKHYEALKRILFIYAKLNPGIRYVQGMNEILGPLYYIFANDNDPLFKDHAEADTFFVFTNLMSEIRDNFNKTLDKDAQFGITGRIARLNNILKAKDYELWQNLEEKKLNPQFYSFRWITLLLSQEFELPDVLRIWDSLFSDPFRFEFLLFICCAMLVYVREQLLDGTFADNLKLLQNYPVQDVHLIIQKAVELKDPNFTPPPSRTPLNTVAESPSSYMTYFGINRTPKSSTPKPPQNKPVNTKPVPLTVSPLQKTITPDSSQYVEEVWHGPITSNTLLPFLPKPFDDEEEKENPPTTTNHSSQPSKSLNHSSEQKQNVQTPSKPDPSKQNVQTSSKSDPPKQNVQTPSYKSHPLE